MTRSYRVWGLTCGQCLALVLERVHNLAGVRCVAVDLVRGGGSRLVITARPAVKSEAVRAAVEGAGFSLNDERPATGGALSDAYATVEV